MMLIVLILSYMYSRMQNTAAPVPQNTDGRTSRQKAQQLRDSSALNH